MIVSFIEFYSENQAFSTY
jgi:hypothetical protein